MPLTDARVRLHELIRQVATRNVLLLRHGRAVAVLMGYERYEAILERIEDLDDSLSVYEAAREPAGMNVQLDKLAAETGLLDQDQG
ncbi:MAG: type II toxin-antitoxin system Phd/YefM family antitoxin [Actinomycetota bacterium]